MKEDKEFKITSNSKYIGLKNKINNIVSQNKESEKKILDCFNTKNYIKKECNIFGNNVVNNKINKKISFDFNWNID